MTTPNMPNLGNVAASGSQFKHNIFATIQKKASGIARRASRPGPAAPATPTTNTPSPMPSQPTGNLKANSVNAGRYRRQQRAQATQTARNTPPAAPPTANTVPTPHAPGIGVQLNANSVAAGRTARVGRSQTGQALSMVQNLQRAQGLTQAISAANTPAPTAGGRHSAGPAQMAAPSSAPGTGRHRAGNVPNAVPAAGATGGAHRAGPPSVTGISQAPGTGRHRAPTAVPNTPATPVVQSLQSRGAPVAPRTPVPSAPAISRSAPSSVIPRVASTPSGLPTQTSGTTVGSSVHQELQRRMAGGPAKTAGSSTPSVASPHAELQRRMNTPSTPSPQFSNVAPKAYPEHQHPEGSSQQILPTLSANQSRPGRPNNFTVGSRKQGSNVQGLGAMGSRLEAGLMRNPIGLPEKKRRV